VANGWIRTQLYDVAPGDTSVAASVAVLLIAITLAACIIPAWRASRIDPSCALRSD
jgi:ABC-type lipoprotein release transport system permease subunit